MTEVTIVGAGPVGLLLATELALAGVTPLVIDQLPEPSRQPKANGMVGQVARFLDMRGVYQRFGGREDGPRPAPGYMFGAMPLDLSTVDSPITGVMIPQREAERHLTEYAAELGVTVRRDHRLAGCTEDGTITVETPDGIREMHTEYLVGADGAHSTVRKLAGIEFPGVTATGTVHRTGHVILTGARPVPATPDMEVPGYGRIRMYSWHRTETGAYAMMQNPDGVTLVSAVEWHQPPVDDDEPMTVAELEASTRRVLGADIRMSAPDTPGPHLLRRRSGTNTRLAETYRRGRVFLAGDAAHVHSAVGGPGLNLGLQDAANLGWKLAAALHGWAPEGLLDTYEAERRPAAERVVMHSLAQSALMSPGAEVTALRTLFTELLGNPDNTQYIADLLAGSDVRYPMDTDGPAVGTLVRDRTLEDGTRLATLLRTGKPLLLGDVEVTATGQAWTDRVAMHIADTAPVLIRPDGYVAWAGGDGLEAALARWFGAAPAMAGRD